MVVLVCVEGYGEADLPQGAGGAATKSWERLAEAEPLERYVKKAEGLHGEKVEAGAAIDEGLGDGHIADGGRAEHRKPARAGGGDGVVF